MEETNENVSVTVEASTTPETMQVNLAEASEDPQSAAPFDTVKAPAAAAPVITSDKQPSPADLWSRFYKGPAKPMQKKGEAFELPSGESCVRIPNSVIEKNKKSMGVLYYWPVLLRPALTRNDSQYRKRNLEQILQRYQRFKNGGFFFSVQDSKRCYSKEGYKSKIMAD